MKPLKKPKTETSTLMIRILLFLHGKDEKNPNVMHFKIEIVEADYFALAFKHCEDYKKTIYDQSIAQIKQNPERLLHHMPIKETGHYELVGHLNCTLMYNENDELLNNGMWKIEKPMVYQLSEDEFDSYKRQ